MLGGGLVCSGKCGEASLSVMYIYPEELSNKTQARKRQCWFFSLSAPTVLFLRALPAETKNKYTQTTVVCLKVNLNPGNLEVYIRGCVCFRMCDSKLAKLFF